MSRPTNFTEIIIVEEYKFFNFLQLSVISSLLGTNVFVSTCTRPSSALETKSVQSYFFYLLNDIF
jgi:hypothetical protein